MAKKISPNDLFTEQDIFKGIRKSAEQTIKTMNSLQGELKETAQTLKKSIGGAKFDSGKAIKNFTKATKEGLKVQKEYAQTQKVVAQAEQQRQKAIQQGQVTEQKRNQTKKTELDLARKVQLAKERENKTREKSKKLAKDEASAYKKLVNATRDLKNQSKDLGAQMLQLEQSGKKNTAEYRKLEQQYNKVTRSARKGDTQLKKLDKTVGDNFRNVGNYKGAISKLSGALGTLGIAFGISTVVRGAFNSITNFEDANAKLSAVLGKTSDETKELQEVQRELGRTTSFTAGEVAELQVELAKLGFSQEEIKASTEGILMLAKASGTDLANASEIAGSTLRAFGLEVNQTGHLADVMAKSFSSSALDITLFKESMKFVAPVSKSANVSLEETTALLSILANNGIKGSQAGTSLKRIMSELAKTGKPLKEALQDVASAGIDLTSAQDEVGRSAQTSLLILADNVGAIDGFTEKYIHADGSAKIMAETMDNTLSGSIKRLGSAWEGFLLDLNDGTGASNSLREAIDFLSDNLVIIMDTVLTLTSIWVKYKTVVMITALQNKLLASGFMQIGKNIGGLKGVIGGISAGFKQLGQAIMTNIVGIVVVALAGVYQQYSKVQGILETTTENQYDLNKAVKEATINFKKEEKDLKRVYDALLNTNNGSEDRARLIDTINKKYGLTLKNLKDEKKFIDQVTVSYALQMATLKEKTKLEIARIKFEKSQGYLAQSEIAYDRGRDAIKIYRDNYSGTVLGFFREIGGLFVENEADLKEQNSALFDVFNSSRKSAKIYEDEYLALQLAFDNAISSAPVVTLPKVGGGTTASVEYDKTLADFQKFYEDYLSIVKKIEALKEDRRQVGAMDVIEGDIMNAVKKATDLGEAEVEVIEKQLATEYDIRITNAEKIADEEKKLRRKTWKANNKERVTNLKKEYLEKLALIPTSATSERNALKLVMTQKMTDLRNQITLEKKILLGLDEETDLKLLKNKDELYNELEDKQNDYNDAINDGLEEYAENVQTKNQKEIDDAKIVADALIDAEAEKWNTLNTLVENSAQFFIEQSNRKIEQIDKEINKAKESYDFFKQLAVSGNIDAKESLAEQQKLIDEAEAKKLKQQRIQQAIELTSSALSTYNNYASQGKDDALAKTISDIGLLQAFINSLPAFYDGTEDTGANGRGLDGKGGFKAILHPNERVIPKHLNDQLGGLSNEELTDIATKYKLNGLKSDSQVMSALDLSLLAGKIDNLTAVVRDKPETNIELGSITQSVVEIVHKTKRGNTTTYNRFKVKK